nr:hypothetical protein 3 - date palm mitochondrion plasmid S [Phoenix dactylifera]
MERFPPNPLGGSVYMDVSPPTPSGGVLTSESFSDTTPIGETYLPFMVRFPPSAYGLVPLGGIGYKFEMESYRFVRLGKPHFTSFLKRGFPLKK